MDLIKRYSGKLPLEDIKGLLEISPDKTIRVNPLLTTRESLIAELKKKGFEVEEHPLHPLAIRVISEPFSVGATTEYLSGRYIVQDAASMVAVSELGIRKKGVVLDITSAPGAKTTHISEELGGKGVVVAIDSNKKRLKSVYYNCERMGCGNVIGINMNAKDVKRLGILFDKVLIDPPCSAEGTIHKNPGLLKKEIPYKKLIKEQLAIVEAGISVLKKGGTMVYSTCTINPDENEGVVRHALNQGMRLTEISTSGGKEGLIPMTRRFYPHTDGTQGFFIARMVKV